MAPHSTPFTWNQIQEAAQKVKSGADFPQFIQDLKSMGVTRYDTFVADGRTLYYAANNAMVDGKAKYEAIAVNPTGEAAKLKHCITIHQQGQTDYATFCLQAAEAGVEKWTTHMVEMTVTYLDQGGNIMLVERIPQP